MEHERMNSLKIPCEIQKSKKVSPEVYDDDVSKGNCSISSVGRASGLTDRSSVRFGYGAHLISWREISK